LSRFRAFQYEVRCWPGGHIPDIAEAIDSPKRLTENPEQVSVFLEILRHTPAFTWGRDELNTGDMWNSNSVLSWALASSGHDMTDVRLPPNGRAPGWRAGLVLAGRDSEQRPLDSAR
jgi:hypothetical protein